MGKVFDSCAATLLTLVLPVNANAGNHGKHAKHNPGFDVDKCMGLATVQDGWAQVGNHVCTVSDSRLLAKKTDISDLSGGSVFASINIMNAEGIPIQRVDMDFYSENKDHPAEIFVSEWRGRFETRQSQVVVAPPKHETPQALLYKFERAAEKSGALQRLGQ